MPVRRWQTLLSSATSIAGKFKGKFFRINKFVACLALVMSGMLATNVYAQQGNGTSNSIDTLIQESPLSTTTNSAVGKGFTPINGLPAVTVKTNADGSQDYTISLQILLMMTALTFLPAMLMILHNLLKILLTQYRANSLPMW